MPAWKITIEPSETGQRVIVEAESVEAEQAAKIAFLKLRTSALADDVSDRVVLRVALVDGKPVDAIVTLKELAALLSDSTLTLNKAAGRI